MLGAVYMLMCLMEHWNSFTLHATEVLSEREGSSSCDAINITLKVTLAVLAGFYGLPQSLQANLS
jgi:hypothetical protein